MAGNGEVGVASGSGMLDSRVPWIDTARGLGILLVVYGHVMRSVILSGLAADGPVRIVGDSLVYAFHMPLFFVISGLVTRPPKRGGRLPFVKDRVLRIAYPYVIWTVIFVLAALIAGGNANTPVGWPELAGMAVQPVAHFWFLYVLFFCSLVLLVPGLWSLAAITLLGMLLVVVIGIGRMPERTAYFLPFFAVGVFVTLPRAAAFLSTERRALAVAAAAWLLFLIAFACSPLVGDGADARLFLMSRWVTGFAGSVGTLAIASLIGGRVPVLCALGRASMPIYLMSPMTAALVRVLLLRSGIVLSEIAWIAVLMIAALVLPWLTYKALKMAGLAAAVGLERSRLPIRLAPGTAPLFDTPGVR